MRKKTISDVQDALNKITGGRLAENKLEMCSGTNPFVVIKSSNIPGKSVMETPGLVYGRKNKKIEKIAVMMTLTEAKIELAGALNIDAIVAHHPVADATNSGGVTLKNYLDLYDIAVFELHEAFHGLHPGISYIHGHEVFRSEIAYGNVPGNIMFVGETLNRINTLGDIIDRVNKFMGIDEEKQMLQKEIEVRNRGTIFETNTTVRSKILVGERNNTVNKILHIFPHTGFSDEHLEMALREHPEVDTLLATISRVKENNILVEKCKQLGLNFIVGNSHALEMFENGLPLAKALEKLLPEIEVLMFRERVTATPIDKFGNKNIDNYAEMIASRFLLKNNK